MAKFVRFFALLLMASTLAVGDERDDDDDPDAYNEPDDFSDSSEWSSDLDIPILAFPKVGHRKYLYFYEGSPEKSSSEESSESCDESDSEKDSEAKMNRESTAKGEDSEYSSHRKDSHLEEEDGASYMERESQGNISDETSSSEESSESTDESDSEKDSETKAKIKKDSKVVKESSEESSQSFDKYLWNLESPGDIHMDKESSSEESSETSNESDSEEDSEKDPKTITKIRIDSKVKKNSNGDSPLRKDSSLGEATEGFLQVENTGPKDSALTEDYFGEEFNEDIYTDAQSESDESSDESSESSEESDSEEENRIGASKQPRKDSRLKADIKIDSKVKKAPSGSGLKDSQTHREHREFVEKESGRKSVQQEDSGLDVELEDYDKELESNEDVYSDEKSSSESSSESSEESDSDKDSEEDSEKGRSKDSEKHSIGGFTLKENVFSNEEDVDTVRKGFGLKEVFTGDSETENDSGSDEVFEDVMHQEDSGLKGEYIWDAISKAELSDTNDSDSESDEESSTEETSSDSDEEPRKKAKKGHSKDSILKEEPVIEASFKKEKGSRLNEDFNEDSKLQKGSNDKQDLENENTYSDERSSTEEGSSSESSSEESDSDEDVKKGSSEDSKKYSIGGITLKEYFGLTEESLNPKGQKGPGWNEDDSDLDEEFTKDSLFGEDAESSEEPLCEESSQEDDSETQRQLDMGEELDGVSVELKATGGLTLKEDSSLKSSGLQEFSEDRDFDEDPFGKESKRKDSETERELDMEDKSDGNSVEDEDSCLNEELGCNSSEESSSESSEESDSDKKTSEDSKRYSTGGFTMKEDPNLTYESFDSEVQKGSGLKEFSGISDLRSNSDFEEGATWNCIYGEDPFGEESKRKDTKIQRELGMEEEPGEDSVEDEDACLNEELGDSNTKQKSKRNNTPEETSSSEEESSSESSEESDSDKDPNADSKKYSIRGLLMEEDFGLKGFELQEFSEDRELQENSDFEEEATWDSILSEDPFGKEFKRKDSETQRELDMENESDGNSVEDEEACLNEELDCNSSEESSSESSKESDSDKEHSEDSKRHSIGGSTLEEYPTLTEESLDSEVQKGSVLKEEFSGNCDLQSDSSENSGAEQESDSSIDEANDSSLEEDSTTQKEIYFKESDEDSVHQKDSGLDDESDIESVAQDSSEEYTSESSSEEESSESSDESDSTTDSDKDPKKKSEKVSRKDSRLKANIKIDSKAKKEPGDDSLRYKDSDISEKLYGDFDVQNDPSLKAQFSGYSMQQGDSSLKEFIKDYNEEESDEYANKGDATAADSSWDGHQYADETQTPDESLRQYCHSKDPPQNVGFAYMAPYRAAATPNITRSIIPKECKPVQLWLVVRAGTYAAKKADKKKFQYKLPQLRREILDAYMSGNGSLCAEDLDLIRKWKLADMNEAPKDSLTDQGYAEIYGIAERFKSLFPDLIYKPVPLGMKPSPHGEKRPGNGTKFAFAPTRQTYESAVAFLQGLYGDAWGHVGLATHGISLLQFGDYCNNYINDVLMKPRHLKPYEIFRIGPQMKKLLVKVRARLGVRMSLSRIRAMFNACRYQQAWNPSKLSPWCVAFTPADFEVLEFLDDLRMYFDQGYGHEVSYAQACILASDIMDNFREKMAQNNTHPADDAIVYFVNAEAMSSFTALLDLFKDSSPLNYNDLNPDRLWRTSKFAGSGSNFAFVLSSCTDNRWWVSGTLNEAPFQLPGCSSPLGCSWEAFSEGPFKDHEKCDFGEICGHTGNNMWMAKRWHTYYIENDWM